MVLEMIVSFSAIRVVLLASVAEVHEDYKAHWEQLSDASKDGRNDQLYNNFRTSLAAVIS